MYEAAEVDGSTIIAGGETPEMLETAKASFDLVAMLIGGLIMGDENLAIAFGRDHDLGLHASNPFTQIIAVIGFIGEYRAGPRVFQKTNGCGDVVCLTGGDPETQ